MIFFKIRNSLAVLLIISLMLSGCQGGSWGRMTLNPALVNGYSEKKLPEDFNYYYCGRSSLPYAVVGIDPSYTFEDRLWFKIETREALYRKIGNISDWDPWHDRMRGRDILGPDGRKIGIWFSYYNGSGVRVDEANRVVEVFNPYRPSSRFRSGQLSLLMLTDTVSKP